MYDSNVSGKYYINSDVFTKNMQRMNKEKSCVLSAI